MYDCYGISVIPHFSQMRVVVSCPHSSNQYVYQPHQYPQGYKKFKGFVIAQAPMGSTCRDFWKMVYDTQCRVIVMLSDHIEEGEVDQLLVATG